MKIEEIGLIPISKKKIIVREMCHLYKKLQLLEINQKNANILMEENKNKDRKIKILKSKSIFEGILELLDSNQQLIITNEFLKNSNTDWSEDY